MGNETEEQSKANNSKRQKDGNIEEQLMRPFNLGWKREVVMRVVTVSNYCDIYYLHPSGKKLRSMTEVKAHLTDGLTPDCFTFKKKPLNVGSEIVRTAVVRGRPSNQAKPVNSVSRGNGQIGLRRRGVNIKSTEKPEYLLSGTRRQRMMQKKERQSWILDVNRLKTNTVPEKKNLKKTVRKATKTTSRGINRRGRPNKSEVMKKTARNIKLNGLQIKVLDRIEAPRKKLENASPGRKRELSDIKSIVQRNIGKYRELRKNQILGKMKDGLRDNSRRNVTYSSLRKRKRYNQRSEPISKNLDKYMKPFERGWRRELVHRMNGQSSEGRSDVYYFHPNGKKLRSTREIADNLTQGLTVDCFTFRKEAIGCGEPHEVVRNARLSKSIPEGRKSA